MDLSLQAEKGFDQFVMQKCIHNFATSFLLRIQQTIKHLDG